MAEVKSELETSIDDVTNAVAAINATQAGIAELRKKYEKVIFEVDTPKGMKDARTARQEIRAPRYEIERLRKEAKAPILALGRQLDAKAKELTEQVLALEAPIDERIKEEEDRAERERQALIETELQRVEHIKARIAGFRAMAESVTLSTPVDEIEHTLDMMIDVDESFQEFHTEARDARGAAMARLREAHAAAVKREAEQIELAELRAAKECRDEEDRKIRDAALAVAEEKRKAEEKKHREEMAEQQQKIDAENNRIAKERLRDARRQEVVNQINLVANLPTQGYGKTVAELSRLLARAQSFTVITESDDLDLLEAADTAKKEAIGAIQSMLEGRQQYEKEVADLAAESAEQARKAKEKEDREAKAAADAKKAKFPGEQAIVDCIVDRFWITEKVAQSWLAQCRGKKAA